MPYHITAHADAINAKSDEEGDDETTVTDETILEQVRNIAGALTSCTPAAIS